MRFLALTGSRNAVKICDRYEVPFLRGWQRDLNPSAAVHQEFVILIIRLHMYSIVLGSVDHRCDSSASSLAFLVGDVADITIMPLPWSLIKRFVDYRLLML